LARPRRSNSSSPACSGSEGARISLPHRLMGRSRSRQYAVSRSFPARLIRAFNDPGVK